MDAPSLNRSISGGLEYLQKVQRLDGGFDSYSSPSATSFHKAYTYQTSFVSALILGVLTEMQLPIADNRIKARLAKFLRRQIGTNGAVNYWTLQSPERQRRPYPDDLDDTCCTYSSLLRHDPASLRPADLVSIIKLLVASETEPGGPYQTWLVDKQAPAHWQDVDIAVNINTAYLLSLISRVPGPLMKYIEQAIRSGNLGSAYYVTEISQIYFLSRFYKGAERHRLVMHAEKLLSQSLGSALHTALLTSSLIRLGAPADKLAVSRLMAAQAGGGSWPAEAFCLDPARDGKTYYNGCESLTTAFAVEALELYKRSGTPSTKRSQERWAARVLDQVEAEISPLGPNLSKSLGLYIRKFAATSTGKQVLDLPMLFNESLRQPLRTEHDEMLLSLASSSLFGWCAYTILDDFADGEGRTAYVPLASACLRLSIDGYDKALPNDAAFQAEVRASFNAMDEALSWELEYCRTESHPLPDYGPPTKLAERSMGHVLAPLAILLTSGYGHDSTAVLDIEQAFIHYLTARQLSDDLHDWQTDMKSGRFSYVVVDIMRGIELGHAAQPYFWHHSMPSFCHIINKQTAHGRRCLERTACLKLDNIISKHLQEIDDMVENTLKSQASAMQFLEAYHG